MLNDITQKYLIFKQMNHFRYNHAYELILTIRLNAIVFLFTFNQIFMLIINNTICIIDNYHY
jgi:hypothetical protein